MHLHETEVPVMLKDGVVPVGYAVHTKDFSFMAIYETDGTVNVYVEWGDDQGDDMVNHPSMSEAKRHFDTLLKSTEPEAPVVKVDITAAVNDSVLAGLKKVGLPDTPHNRIEVLNGMYTKLLSEKNVAGGVQPILTAIEDALVQLQDGD